MRNQERNRNSVSSRGLNQSRVVLTGVSRRRSRKSAMATYPLTAFCVLGLLLLLLSVFLNMSSEKVEAKADYEKVFVAVEIQPGDTLWGYAEQYAHSDYYDSKREYIEEVCSLNALEDGTIYAGKTIALPMIRRKHNSARK